MRNYEILHANLIFDNQKKLLSQRELEVLILVAAGFENAEMALVFRVTLSTIKKQLEKIFIKLKAKNRANAVFIAQHNNIISSHDYDVVLNSPDVADVLNNSEKSKERKHFL